jgi:hypothetical protein
MNKRDKQREVFLELVNKQLEPHGKCYEDVKNDPDWFMHYNTTYEQEQDFISWGVSLLCEKLKMNIKMAQNEMSWFILQWGLTTKNAQYNTDIDADRELVAKNVVKRSK